jgi:copper chaperone
MENLVLKVEGMTCGGCSGSVEKALGSQDGVKTVSASHEQDQVSVEFDPSIIALTSIEAAIVDAGFDVVK